MLTSERMRRADEALTEAAGVLDDATTARRAVELAPEMSAVAMSAAFGAGARAGAARGACVARNAARSGTSGGGVVHEVSSRTEVNVGRLAGAAQRATKACAVAEACIAQLADDCEEAIFSHAAVAATAAAAPRDRSIRDDGEYPGYEEQKRRLRRWQLEAEAAQQQQWEEYDRENIRGESASEGRGRRRHRRWRVRHHRGRQRQRGESDGELFDGSRGVSAIPEEGTESDGDEYGGARRGYNDGAGAPQRAAARATSERGTSPLPLLGTLAAGLGYGSATTLGSGDSRSPPQQSVSHVKPPGPGLAAPGGGSPYGGAARGTRSSLPSTSRFVHMPSDGASLLAPELPPARASGGDGEGAHAFAPAAAPSGGLGAGDAWRDISPPAYVSDSPLSELLVRMGDDLSAIWNGGPEMVVSAQRARAAAAATAATATAAPGAEFASAAAAPYAAARRDNEMAAPAPAFARAAPAPSSAPLVRFVAQPTAHEVPLWRPSPANGVGDGARVLVPSRPAAAVVPNGGAGTLSASTPNPRSPPGVRSAGPSLAAPRAEVLTFSVRPSAQPPALQSPRAQDLPRREPVPPARQQAPPPRGPAASYRRGPRQPAPASSAGTALPAPAATPRDAAAPIGIAGFRIGSVPAAPLAGSAPQTSREPRAGARTMRVEPSERLAAPDAPRRRSLSPRRSAHGGGGAAAPLSRAPAPPPPARPPVLAPDRPSGAPRGGRPEVSVARARQAAHVAWSEQQRQLQVCRALRAQVECRW